MSKHFAALACAALLVATSASAQSSPVTDASAIYKASDLPDPPVIAGDINDRPYTVVGQITAGVRKATVFSKSSSPDKIYRELWERGKKIGADAVVHASFGAAHVSAMSWGQTTATGVAIKFSDHAPQGGRN